MQFIWKRLSLVPVQCLWVFSSPVAGYGIKYTNLSPCFEEGQKERNYSSQMRPSLRRGPVLLYRLTIKSCSQSFTNTNPRLEDILVPFVGLVVGGKSLHKSLPDRQKDRVLSSLPAPSETGPNPSLPEEQCLFTGHSLAKILTLAGVFPPSSASEKVLTLWLWWM